MTAPVRLAPTTLAHGSPGFEEAHGPRRISRQLLEQRFTPAELDTLGYARLEQWRREHHWPVEPDPALDMLPGLRAMLDGAMEERDMSVARAVLETGLRTDLDTMNFGCDPTGETPPDVEEISAMAYAVLLDSQSGMLEYLPLLAEFGDIHQVGSHGRTLVAYASHPSVIGFLLDAGVRIDAIDEDDVPAVEFRGTENARLIEALALERALPAGRTRDAVPRL